MAEIYCPHCDRLVQGKDWLTHHRQEPQKRAAREEVCAVYQSKMLGGICQNCGHGPADHK